MPVDAPGEPIAGTATISTVPPGRVHGTLAGRIALVTTTVALLTAIIVAAVAVPQIRAAALAEGLIYLGQTADTVMNSVERADQRIGPRQRLGEQGDDIDIIIVRPGATYPDYVNQLHAGQLESSGRIGYIVDYQGGTLLVQGRMASDGTAVLFVQAGSSTGENTARDITRLAVALAVGVAIAAVSGVVLARRLARPLKVAAAAAEEMAQGVRDIAITPDGPREVAEVAESLNDLNAALNVSEARQREFLLSVSHELRTPLTSIRGYAEAFADGVLQPDDVGPAATLMVAESQRLERIVSDLLDLARMGAREVRIDAVETDLVPLLNDAASVWSSLCAAEGVDFATDFSGELLQGGPVWLVTDATRLRQIVDNLLTNALRMTPPGQPIVLAGSADADVVTVAVRDGGPGLTDDDLKVAFEPAELYSRYRGVRAVGSGVGLALVGRMAERLGGVAEAGHAPEGGAAFMIRLPRAGPMPG